MKGDIKKYFPSLPHSKLKTAICSHIADNDLKALIGQIIDSFHTDINYLARYNIPPLSCDPNLTGRGIPIGNQTSQVFGMFYLDPLDRTIKEKCRQKIYSRYMDDFISICRTKEEAQNVLQKAQEVVGGLDLFLKKKPCNSNN